MKKSGPEKLKKELNKDQTAKKVRTLWKMILVATPL